MGLIDRIRAGHYRPDKTISPVVPGRILSLAEVAMGMHAGSGRLGLVRDFLDQVPHLDEESAANAIAERPPATTPEGDALLGAIAEWVASHFGVASPSWAIESDRFLEHFWYVSDVKGLRAVALAETPVALKRRGVIWSSRSMARV